MRLKLRIILFQLILGLAVIVMGSIAVATITTTTNKLQRARHARLQLDAAMQLAVHANRYSEQIAELLLIGSPERPDFEGAREQVIESLRQCSDVTRLEIASLRDAAEREEESLELDRLRSMRSLFREIDLAVERLLLLSQEGRQQEAVALFRSEIENRLDADFERLIAALVADERSEAARVDDEITRSARRMTLGTIAVLALILGVTVASGLHFYRAIEPPLRALTEGTVAIERGDLGHRVPHARRTSSVGSPGVSTRWRKSSSASVACFSRAGRPSSVRLPNARRSWRRRTAASRSSTGNECSCSPT
jgi:two-component system, OmpR family, sensor kinase